MSISAATLYAYLPTSLQNLACSLVGYHIKQTRFDSAFHAMLNQYRSRSSDSTVQVTKYQNSRLETFLRVMGKTRNDLQHHPILTKTQIQSSAFLPSYLPLSRLVPIHTSGTTGAGLRFYATRQAIQEQWAVWWRYRNWHGIPFNEKCGYFGGRTIVPIKQREPPFWRSNWAGNQILFSGYHMSPDNLRFYIDALNRYQPPWIHGYPSNIALLAAYSLQNNRPLNYPLKWITTGAENLLEQQRLLIEKAFHVRPRQHYGMAEAVANISECPLGNLHVDEDFAYVEFIPADDGNGHRIIGTNFTNPAFPLIRYDTGDHAQISNRTCSCGRPGRIVDTIDGRQEDYILLKDGRRIGRMAHIFKDMVQIREAQLVQIAPGGIIVRIVKGPEYSAQDEKKLVAEMQNRLGADITLDFDYVDAIPRTAAGKLRFVISEIDDGKLTGLLSS